jgi:hypothetical protein
MPNLKQLEIEQDEDDIIIICICVSDLSSSSKIELLIYELYNLCSLKRMLKSIFSQLAYTPARLQENGAYDMPVLAPSYLTAVKRRPNINVRCSIGYLQKLC